MYASFWLAHLLELLLLLLFFSVVLILFALFRHFYSWTALRELHKGIESSVLGTNYTGSGLPNFAARDHSDYKQTHTKAHSTHTVLMKCTHRRLRVMAFYWQHFIRNAWVARNVLFFCNCSFYAEGRLMTSSYSNKTRQTRISLCHNNYNNSNNRLICQYAYRLGKNIDECFPSEFAYNACHKLYNMLA